MNSISNIQYPISNKKDGAMLLSPTEWSGAKRQYPIMKGKNTNIKQELNKIECFDSLNVTVRILKK